MATLGTSVAPGAGVTQMYLRPGDSASHVLKVATLPKGTLLFRAIHLRDPAEDPWGLDLFQDLLGFPVGSSYCLSPIQNVYCFGIPYVGFGLYDWNTKGEAWRKYNAFMVYALTEDTKFVLLLKPADAVRGTPKGWTKPGDAIRRCDLFPPTTCYKGRPNEAKKTAEFQKGQSWDNCLDPGRRSEEGLGGWIAVAEGDSIDVTEGKGRAARRIRSRLTPMGKYLTSLGGREIAGTLPHMVVDARGTRGFPEIVVNPRKSGVDTLVRRVGSFRDSLDMVSDDLLKRNLAFAPVATITGTGFYFYDGDTVGFRHEGVGSSSESRNMRPEARRRRIEENSRILMERFGKGEIDGFPAITFDRRTGFFVIGGAGQDGRMGLRTAEDWKAVTQYCIGVKGDAPGSEFIFQRPASIRRVLADLEIPYEGNAEVARTARNLIEMERGVLMGGSGGETAILNATVANSTRKNKRYVLEPLNVMKNTVKNTVKNTMKNTMKNNKNKEVGGPNPETISLGAMKHLEEMYSGLGGIVKDIFTK